MINLKVNGKDYQVDSSTVERYTTLNDFLRAQPGLRGVKHNCGQGGCGVCVVALTRGTTTTSVNSCLRPLASCDGMEVTTIEGLGSPENPHAVQKAFADNNASQCGFCTPGQIMSTYGELQRNPNATKKDLEEALDGNLCRCTGYSSIVAAATSFSDTFHSYSPATGSFTSTPARALEFQGWLAPTSLSELKTALASAPKGYRLVVGNTSSGVYPMPVPPLYINIAGIPELQGIQADGTYGALTTISEFQEHEVRLKSFIRRVASAPIRNVGTVVGNIMMAQTKGFVSDLYTALCALGATVTLGDGSKVALGEDFLALDMHGKVIVSFNVPLPSPSGEVFFVRKVALRSRFAHSFVNIAMRGAATAGVINRVSLWMGGLPGVAKRMRGVEAALVGKSFTDEAALQAALEALKGDIGTLPEPTSGGNQWGYRAGVARALVYKAVLSLNPEPAPSLASAVAPLLRPTPTGTSDYGEANPITVPIGEPVPKLAEMKQCTGRTLYSGDEPVLPGTLYCSPVTSGSVGDILSIDASSALAMDGVVAFYDAKDLVDPNYEWSEGEPLFASKRCEFAGQTVGVLVATSQLMAQMAANIVTVSIKSEKPLLTIDDGLAAHRFYNNPTPSYPVKQGDVEKGLSQSARVISGRAESTAQMQFPMEPITAQSVPEEDDALRVVGTFQNQMGVQGTIAAATGLPRRQIRVETRRLGGAFGVKITMPSVIAACTAVAARNLGVPVRCTLRIEEMSRMCGGRNPVRLDYKVGVEADGTLVAADFKFYHQGGGYVRADAFSANVVVESATNAYHFPNIDIDMTLVGSNLPCFTSSRGPGWAQGVFLVESMMENLASQLNMDPVELRMRNLYAKGATTPYGMPVYIDLNSMVNQLKASSGYNARLPQIEQYNAQNKWTKRGIALVPIRFNVNNSGSPYAAQIAAYPDGTVRVETGGIDMGQGLFTKVAQAVAMKLAIEVKDISVGVCNTFTGAGNTVTGGSIGSELAVKAAMTACDVLLARIAPYKGVDFKATVAACAQNGVDLRATGWANLPAPTDPDSYDTYGAAIVEVYVDLLTGEHQIIRSDIVMDLGASMNPLLDVGQIRGAYMMGIGLFTTEQIFWDPETARVWNDSTWEYKIPGIMDLPWISNVSLLKNNPNPRGILSSKAVGEPPLLMGCAVLFAIKDALKRGRAAFGPPGNALHLPSPAGVANVFNVLALQNIPVPKNFTLS